MVGYCTILPMGLEAARRCALVCVLVALPAAALGAEADGGQPLGDILGRARTAEERHLYAEALDEYERALAIEPSADLHVAAARQAIGLERMDAAVEHLNRALELQPDHAGAHTLLGTYHQTQSEDFERAIGHYRAAIEGDPSYAPPRERLGNLFIDLHRHEEAGAVFEALIRAAPENAAGYLGLGRTSLHGGDAEAAAGRLRKAMELDPDDPEPHRWMARVLGRLGDRDGAREAMRRHQELKDAENRLKHLLRLTRREPDNGRHWFALGQEYMRRGRYPSASEAFETGLLYEPSAHPVRSALAALYIRAKRIPEARAHLEIAVQQNPNPADDYNNLGVCHMMAGEYRLAAQAFRTALEMGSAAPGVERNLRMAQRKAMESNQAKE